MIGLLVRSVVGESLGTCGMILGPIIGIAAICGIIQCCQCCQCRLRDCRCCKRILRATGADPFDDFEIMVLVHKVTFTASSKTQMYVRVKAGEHEVSTDPETSGVFQQALSVFIEQGTETLKFQLLNTSDKVLAELEMNIMKEVLHTEQGKPCGSQTVMEKTFNMKQKNKNLLNPRIVLTIAPESNDEEQALLHGLNTSQETEWMLHQQLQKTQAQADKLGNQPDERSDIGLLSRGCFGPVHMFGKLGSKHLVYVGVIKPADRKKFAFCVWGSESDCENRVVPKQQFELLHISAVAPDPNRPEVFTITHIEKDKAQHKLFFQRIDRGRDVWVEMLQLLVTKVHEEHEVKKKERKK